MTTANEIRYFVLKNYIQPARNRSEKTVSFTAADIHEAMSFENRYPLVCSSIDTDKFLDYASVTLVSRKGPKQSNTVQWVFALG
jgi:hypothetical protein